MDTLAGKQLTRKSGETVTADDVLKDKAVIAFYFSAHWCPPCRMFTPVLADFYQELKDEGAAFEVVFVSSDRSANEMVEYLKESHGDWLAVLHNSPEAQELKTKYGITGIPALVVVKTDGTIITKDGRKDVQSKGTSCFKTWNQ